MAIPGVCRDSVATSDDRVQKAKDSCQKSAQLRISLAPKRKIFSGGKSI